MKSRLELQELLEGVLGSNKVYYQASSRLFYPCIVYEKSDHFYNYADNLKYKNKVQYTVTLIGKTADNDEIVNKLLALDYCGYDRRFVSDNLYHDVFTLYF